MFYETKIYNDGSHYIAIPHTTRPAKKRPPSAPVQAIELENGLCVVAAPAAKPEPIRQSRKELFNQLFDEHKNLPRAKRKDVITDTLRPHFTCDEQVKDFVTMNFERKLRNTIARRVRCTRKANLQEFNYFVTFTYDGKIHDEMSFKKKLRNCLSHFCTRKEWKYIGVWERSPEKQRLHFHGIVYIPDGTMPGFLLEVNDYNFKTHKRQTTFQNTYFNERFGRSDFEPIADRSGLYDAIAYLLKYIEKSGERIVYSKGLPQYFISDVEDNDVVCTIGQEDRKLLLFDDFRCWDAGQYVGRVSKETIQRMRTANN